MSPRRPPLDEDEAKARRILRALAPTEQRRAPKSYSGLILLLTFALILAIVGICLANRERFAFLWRHLLHPDSLPGN